MKAAAVKDVMTTHVVAVRQDATYKIMVASLRGHHISALPVLDDQDKVIGVVSEADLLTKEALEVGPHGYSGGILPHEQQAKATGVTAADLMTRPAITIAVGDTAAQAARLMYGKRVKRLPVVTGNGHLVGIVSRADVLSVYSRPDGDIRNEITETLLPETFRTDPARFTVTVTNGVVTIEGEPETRTIGLDIIDSVRHVEGVVAVRDRLSYPLDERPSSQGPLS
ncbi:MAG TPA: CBS domain-containing protein [Trebonia sp.]